MSPTPKATHFKRPLLSFRNERDYRSTLASTGEGMCS